MKQKANDHQSLAFLLEYINFEISMFRVTVRMASQGLMANGQWLFLSMFRGIDVSSHRPDG